MRREKVGNKMTIPDEHDIESIYKSINYERINDLSNELLYNSIILNMFIHTEARIGYYQGQDSTF